MKKLDQDYFVLWASLPTEGVPFEVSREVATPLLPKCENSPYCPDERTLRLIGEKDPESGNRSESKILYEIDPEFVFDPKVCPYAFTSKDGCFRAINRKALREGCIPEGDVRKVANFLKSMGYKVWGERMSKSDKEGGRILLAHGPIFHFHELRVENGPAGLVLYLIRNPREDERAEGSEEL